MDCENRLSDSDSLVRELMRYLRKVRYDGKGDGLVTTPEMSNRESDYVVSLATDCEHRLSDPDSLVQELMRYLQ